MNRLATQILLLVSLVSFTVKVAADDRWETLRAINLVENPTNHTRVGRFGELGPYQFRPSTWRMHSRRPFSQAIQREAADEVAVLHYEWIKQELERAGVDASPFNIAMAWNSGLNNVINGRVPGVAYNYAERVTNLVHTFKQRARSTALAATTIPTPAPAVVDVPKFSLEKPVVNFAMLSDAPKFEIAVPAPAEELVVYTDHEPAPAETVHRFTFTTTATLTPRFSLLPSLLD
ncbi:MAG TPA: hypothetical protein VIM71_15470 [Lacunisphaera sp.]